MIVPLGARIVAVAEKPATTTAGGLELSTGSQDKSYIAEVAAVGPDVLHIKKGDRIVYKESLTHPIKLEQSEYIILNEEDVLGTV